ncbi:response regulator transcription factor [Pseudoxanthomonas daejeonensis]|uniref:DNA-binding response regulator n=1 Tax=Pseudoxanthomonas daejeonensis TaxID=266062 RepID=A0ABQ6ZAX3_9GAMM|nr:response regulator [Pseudoxanthomonas daejeonensis]KAF1697024.1 DNA-binding response regulator [Pseudoxanthomonas daejeonensis]
MSALVHIVDDDPDVLKALARLLASDGFEVALSGSTREFLEAYDPATTGCIVLDLSMPGTDGLELQAMLARQGVSQPVIFLTGCGDIASSVRAMKAGAIDFLTKPVDVEALLEAVKRGVSMDDATRHRDHDREDACALLATLTPRERELVPRLMTGRLNKQIAADLGIAEKTIKVHRSRILHKLGIRSLVDLVRFMERTGAGAGDAGATPAASPPAAHEPVSG